MKWLKQCPRCNTAMANRALVDSDDRIYAKWQCCPCGYDTRDCPPEQAELDEVKDLKTWPEEIRRMHGVID